MSRQRKPFIRKSGKRDAQLFVIASEGQKTEAQYFKAIKETYRNPRIHIEALERDFSASAPAAIIKMLDDFKKTYKLDKNDELWLLMDRDQQSWAAHQIIDTRKLCRDKKYLFALSNPCFELWLLLHIKDIQDCPQVYLDKLLANQKINHNRTFVEGELIAILGSHHKGKLNTQPFLPKSAIQQAIHQAKQLNPPPAYPDHLIAEVYELVEKLIS